MAVWCQTGWLQKYYIRQSATVKSASEMASTESGGARNSARSLSGPKLVTKLSGARRGTEHQLKGVQPVQSSVSTRQQLLRSRTNEQLRGIAGPWASALKNSGTCNVVKHTLVSHLQSLRTTIHCRPPLTGFCSRMVVLIHAWSVSE